MSEFTIYHNPRCSKSRQTLALLQEHGIDPNIVLYLEQVPSADDIQSLLNMLGIDARALLRKGEEAYKELNLANPEITEAQIIEAMTQHPKLIERPVVTRSDRAVIGRPPENVKTLLD